MTHRLLLLPIVALTLSSCGPELDIESIAGRTFMITNREDGDVRVERVIANDEDGRAECVREPGALLGPGRSVTVTFFDCGEVREVEVETDGGSVQLELS
jgi:hypothetical protein